MTHKTNTISMIENRVKHLNVRLEKFNQVLRHYKGSGLFILETMHIDLHDTPLATFSCVTKNEMFIYLCSMRDTLDMVKESAEMVMNPDRRKSDLIKYLKSIPNAMYVSRGDAPDFEVLSIEVYNPIKKLLENVTHMTIKEVKIMLGRG